MSAHKRKGKQTAAAAGDGGASVSEFEEAPHVETQPPSSAAGALAAAAMAAAAAAAATTTNPVNGASPLQQPGPTVTVSGPGLFGTRPFAAQQQAQQQMAAATESAQQQVAAAATAQAQMQAQAQQLTMLQQQQMQQYLSMQAALQAAPMQMQQQQQPQQRQPSTPTRTAKKSELEKYKVSVDAEARKAAARSSKKYADDEDAYLREEFQKIGREQVRRAEKKAYSDDKAALRRLRRKRGQPAVTPTGTDESGSDSGGGRGKGESSDSDSDGGSSGNSGSDSDGSGRARKRRKKGSDKKPGQPIEWARLKKGRAHSKGRSKTEKRAEDYYARMLGSTSRFTSARNDSEARRMHQVRMLVAQMSATDATVEQVEREVAKMLETMTDALLAYDQGPTGDSQGQVRLLLDTITIGVRKQPHAVQHDASSTPACLHAPSWCAPCPCWCAPTAPPRR